jgi:hypothetical protein
MLNLQSSTCLCNISLYDYDALRVFIGFEDCGFSSGGDSDELKAGFQHGGGQNMDQWISSSPIVSTSKFRKSSLTSQRTIQRVVGLMYQTAAQAWRKQNPTFKVFWIRAICSYYRALQTASTGYFPPLQTRSPYPLLNQETDAPIISSIAVMHEIELRLWVIFVHAKHLRGGTSDLAGLEGVDLLAVLVEAHARRGSAVTATLTGTDTLWCVSKSLCECACSRT